MVPIVGFHAHLPTMGTIVGRKSPFVPSSRDDERSDEAMLQKWGTFANESG